MSAFIAAESFKNVHYMFMQITRQARLLIDQLAQKRQRILVE